MAMTLPAMDLAERLRQLKPMQLRLMAELSETGALGRAAERLGIAQPAASRLLAEIEDLLGHRLRERQGRGLRLTPAGTALARRAARVQIELADAAREVTEAATGQSGVVRVGSVTGPALRLVLPAIADVQRACPGVLAEVTVATSVLLCDQLRDGRLDFALARPLPGATGLAAQLLASEPLSLVVRRGHPLLSLPVTGMADLLRYDWVMGEDGTLLTQTVLARLAALRLPPPRRQVSTSSFLFTLALLTRTDAIAPLATAVADSFSGPPSMPVAPLPVDLGLAVAPFSLVTRDGSGLTPAARRLAEAILARIGPAGAGA
jgi:DNA-binding transcriptional LysR family regulator